MTWKPEEFVCVFVCIKTLCLNLYEYVPHWRIWLSVLSCTGHWPRVPPREGPPLRRCGP